LETTCQTDSGAVTLIDWMPLRSWEAELARLVVGLRGQVAMRLELIIRFDYGAVIPWIRRLDVYGEVMDALHLARRAGLERDDNACRV